MPPQNESDILLDAVIATGAGASKQPSGPRMAFQADGVTSAGAGAVDVDVEASLDGVAWVVLGTISLVLSTILATDGFASDAPWKFIRGNVTSISGTDATVTLRMGAPK